jgi:hypothetical protein
MIQKNVITLFVFVFVLFFPVTVSPLFGHGIQLTVEKKFPCVIVNAKYHGGSALKDAGVTVTFDTGKEEPAFQEGKTDKNGNFCFFPDKTGKWIVLVDDLTGHRKKIEVMWDMVPPKEIPSKKTAETPVIEMKKDETASIPTTSTTPASEWCCTMLKIILGVVSILGITFIMYRLKKR